jgi:hypothetical protein
MQPSGSLIVTIRRCVSTALTWVKTNPAAISTELLMTVGAASTEFVAWDTFVEGDDAFEAGFTSAND